MLERRYLAKILDELRLFFNPTNDYNLEIIMLTIEDVQRKIQQLRSDRDFAMDQMGRYLKPQETRNPDVSFLTLRRISIEADAAINALLWVLQEMVQPCSKVEDLP